MGFSRQEYWSRLPFPSPADLFDPGIKPRSPALQAASLLSEPQRLQILSCIFTILSRRIVMINLCVSLTVPWGAQVKYYFLVCLWGCFRRKLASELVDWVKIALLSMGGHHRIMRAWITEQKVGGKNVFCLPGCRAGTLVFCPSTRTYAMSDPSMFWLDFTPSVLILLVFRPLYLELY